MKPIDFYAAPKAFELPKWVGVVIGGTFVSIIGASAIVVFQFTHPAMPAAPVAASVVGATQPGDVVTPSAAPDVKAAPESAKADATSAPAPKSASMLPAHLRTHAKHPKRALAGVALPDGKKAAQILARHETKEKRRQKDEIDRLLGM